MSPQSPSHTPFHTPSCTPCCHAWQGCARVSTGERVPATKIGPSSQGDDAIHLGVHWELAAAGKETFNRDAGLHK